MRDCSPGFKQNTRICCGGQACFWVGFLYWDPERYFSKAAWSALVSRTPHMDLPIALGLGVGGITGTVNTLLAYGEIYFDSLAVLVFLLLVGR